VDMDGNRVDTVLVTPTAHEMRVTGLKSEAATEAAP
jgi:hypothetical protein